MSFSLVREPPTAAYEALPACLLFKGDHKETVEGISDIAFPLPVMHRLPGIGEQKVAASFKAIECLDRAWPDWPRGRSWRNALISYNHALKGWRATNVPGAGSSRLLAARRSCPAPNPHHSVQALRRFLR